MGIAQGMGDLLLLAEALLDRSDIGFLFIGRGSDMEFLKLDARKRGLVNTVFCDEIEADEIPSLYAQCHVGLIALDARHKTHNIPGKFISYLEAGLPVAACVNSGNDLIDIIQKNALDIFVLCCKILLYGCLKAIQKMPFKNVSPNL
jgi:hypothetical protein